MFYTCVSFCSRGRGSWLPGIHRRSYDQGVCIEDGGSASRGGWADPPPPPQSTTGYGQQAGGTHPTGMHSCSKYFKTKQINLHCLRTRFILPFWLLKHCKHLQRSLTNNHSYTPTLYVGELHGSTRAH